MVRWEVGGGGRREPLSERVTASQLLSCSQDHRAEQRIQLTTNTVAATLYFTPLRFKTSDHWKYKTMTNMKPEQP